MIIQTVIFVLKILLLIIVILIINLSIYLFFLDKYKFYYHEYGHVLKIIENSVKDIDNYIEEMKSDKINIQVIEFTKFFRILTLKRKTYSDYFEYLENKKQETDYQKIIKDIAIGGYKFSKKFKIHIKFYVLCAFLTIIEFISILKVVSFVLAIIISITIIIAINPITIYRYFCKAAYGLLPKSSYQGMNDYYIYLYPSKFKYTNLEEDAKSIKGKPKILLKIEIDFSNQENPETNILKQDKFYEKIIEKIHLQ